MNGKKFFSATYADARQRFLDQAAALGAPAESHTIEGVTGLEGEPLAMDAVFLGDSDAQHLVVTTSGTHGVEGFCGSACQLAALHDAPLQALLKKSDVAVLLVHATNPYGFSYMSRTTEDNIDLNRNSFDFSQPLPKDPGYDEIHALLIPDTWPPTPDNAAAIAHYIATRGERAYQEAVTTGQYTHPTGMFYGGKAQGWSTRTLYSFLKHYGKTRRRIAWIDFHTGLGPYGHGEKICVGRSDKSELENARAWWGADVTSPLDGTSVAANVAGPISDTLRAACGHAEQASIALEFGTVPLTAMLHSLRADMWLRHHPEAPIAQQKHLRADIRAVFDCDDELWRGQILGQGRVALLQAVRGVSRG